MTQEKHDSSVSSHCNWHGTHITAVMVRHSWSIKKHNVHCYCLIVMHPIYGRGGWVPCGGFPFRENCLEAWETPSKITYAGVRPPACRARTTCTGGPEGTLTEIDKSHSRSIPSRPRLKRMHSAVPSRQPNSIWGTLTLLLFPKATSAFLEYAETVCRVKLQNHDQHLLQEH